MHTLKRLILLLISSLLLLACASSEQIVKEVKSAPHQKHDNKYKIITYNIQDVFGKNQEKLSAFMKTIEAEDYDFIFLQELFSERSRKFILSNLDSNKYRSIISRIDYQSLPESFYNDAGLFYFSKHSHVDLSDISFSDKIQNSGSAIYTLLDKEVSLSTDFLANKSVAGSLYKLNNSSDVFFCSTHVQALGSKRLKIRQYQQIQSFIAEAVYRLFKAGVTNPEKLSVVLVGDFNADAYREKYVLPLMTHLGNPRDLHLEYYPDKEEYTFYLKLFNLKVRFDYIFAYDFIGDLPLKPIETSFISVSDIVDKRGESISDHLALKAIIDFSTKPPTTPKKHPDLLRVRGNQ